MRRDSLALLLVTTLVLAPYPAFAAPSPPKSESPPPPTQPENRPATQAPDEDRSTAERALAEKEYKKGYKDSEEAKRLKKEGKTDAAKEKFAKALKRFEEAVKIHEPYAEAWNMIGYCARNLGDLKRAFDAYDRSLAIDPDYDEAHEYLGEAYVMTGNLQKAREQLAWLEARKSEEAAELAEAIAAAEKAGAAKRGAAESAPAEGAPAAAPPAPPDSAGTR
jgi:tetratricopeptide (TPR) repeat protein